MYQIKMTIFLLLGICAQGIAQTRGIAVSVDNTLIHYRTYGAGRPLLIINGGPGMNSDGFEDLAKTLSDEYLTIIYDQRGTGKSVMAKIDETTMTLDLMLEDIESIRKQLDIETWHILGHSFGGMLASAYATVYPQRIDRMVLSSSGGIDLDLLTYFRESLNSKLTQEQLDSLAYWNGRIAKGDTSYHARLGRGRSLAPGYVLDQRYYPVIAHRLTQGNTYINQLMWDDLRKHRFNCADRLKSFDRPVLIIQGKQDIVMAKTAHTAQRVLWNSRVVLMDHCIHYGWLDNPEVYFGEVRRFFGA